MPAPNDSDSTLNTSVSVLPASHAVSAPPALPAASSESAAEGGPPSFGTPDDLPPLDPMLEPVAYRRAELERLGERIAELSSRIQAATYDLLALIREFDAGSGWSGWTSCAQWLSWRGAVRRRI